jgi:hypothetical protein
MGVLLFDSDLRCLRREEEVLLQKIIITYQVSSE